MIEASRHETIIILGITLLSLPWRDSNLEDPPPPPLSLSLYGSAQQIKIQIWVVQVEDARADGTHFDSKRLEQKVLVQIQSNLEAPDLVW